MQDEKNETVVKSIRISKSALPIIEDEAKKNYRTLQKQVCFIIDEWIKHISKIE
jgi:hypothetical protein